MEKYSSKIAPTFYVKNVETLKTLAHPQRLDILRQLDEPRTVKEIAARIEADPTKLYYHIRMMEKAGLIQVVETKVVSGIIEKTYLVTASNFQVDESLVSAETMTDSDFDALAKAIFDATRSQIRRSYRAGLIKVNQPENERTISLMNKTFTMTKDQLLHFNEQVQNIVDDIERWGAENEDSEQETEQYTFTVAFLPIISEQ